MNQKDLLNMDFALKQIIEHNPNETRSTELLSWTLTYLVKQGDRVTMKTVFIPEQKK